MTISQSAKDKSASSRFMLVRLTVARNISLDLSAWSPGATITMSLPGLPIKRLSSSGTDFTKVDAIGVTLDTWSFDEATGLLSVYPNDPPDNDVHVFIVYYDLYYSSDISRMLPATPTDSTTTLREWQPLLEGAPTVSQTVSDVVSGVMSLASTDIQIIDTDRSFRAHLNAKSSFSNQDVSVWLCVNSTADISLVFRGLAQHVSCSGERVSVSVLDGFSVLRQPCYMGDPARFSVMAVNSTFPYMDPTKVGSPVRYIAGTTSRFVTKTLPDVTSAGIILQKITEGTEAVCETYSSQVSNTTNRLWAICRVPADTATQTFGIVNASSHVDVATIHTTYLKLSSPTNLQIGDTVRWTVAAVDYYGLVVYNQPFTYSAVPYDIAVQGDTLGNLDAGATLHPVRSLSICVVGPDGVIHYMDQIADYTLNTQTIASGNGYVNALFTTGMEARHPGIGDFHPSTHQVFFRVSPTGSCTHGTLVKKMCESVGLAVNTSTITAADAELVANVAFSVPNYGESDYSPTLKYLEDLLASTLGVVSADSDSPSSEVRYNLLTLPTATTPVIDTSLYLRQSLTTDIEYQDVYTTVQAFNPHVANLDAVTASGPNATVVNNAAARLHGLSTTLSLQHCLADISGRISAIAALRSARRVTYTFDTATQNLSTLVTDQIYLSTTDVLGDTKMVSLRVTGTSKTTERTTITATDYEGL